MSGALLALPFLSLEILPVKDRSTDCRTSLGLRLFGLQSAEVAVLAGDTRNVRDIRSRSGVFNGGQL